jgi:hypothetical protein
MKDCCKEVLEALQIMQAAIDNALVPKEDKDQKDWRIAFNEWVNSTKSVTFDPPQIVCDSYEQKGVFVPAERPTPKPILVAYVGTELLCKAGSKELQEKFLEKIVIDLNSKLKGEYHVIASTSSIDPQNVTFEIL